MATDKPEMPHTQTSAPSEDRRTTKDLPPRRDAGSEGGAPRQAEPERHERMPAGADEPGAGL
jgi:hypothetical protein